MSIDPGAASSSRVQHGAYATGVLAWGIRQHPNAGNPSQVKATAAAAAAAAAGSDARTFPDRSVAVSLLSSSLLPPEPYDRGAGSRSGRHDLAGPVGNESR